MRIALIQIILLSTLSIAFCEDAGFFSGSGKEFAAVLTIAGTATVGIALLGIRYLIMGDSATGVLGRFCFWLN